MTSRSSGNSSSRNYNRYERNENDNNGGNHHGSNHHDSSSSSSSSKFCAVCSAAGRPDFNTHYVRADKFDRSSAITCPYLLSIQCRICGANGHTASYCERRSSSSVRLPPISRTAAPTSSSSEHQHQHQRLRAPPRIVFEEHRDRDPNPTQQQRQLPPLKFVPRVQNDEPLMRRGPAEASPVHSPEKPRRPRSNNPFALLEPSSSDSESDYYSPVTKQPPSQQSPDSSPKNVGRYRGIEDVKEWPVLPPAAAHKPSSKPKIVPRVALGGGPVLPLVPPPVFKSNSKSNSKSDKKKNWGDTDSEDDEEFLKRGLE